MLAGTYCIATSATKKSDVSIIPVFFYYAMHRCSFCIATISMKISASIIEVVVNTEMSQSKIKYQQDLTISLVVFYIFVELIEILFAVDFKSSG
jgi:hypothetical protein